MCFWFWMGRGFFYVETGQGELAGWHDSHGEGAGWSVWAFQFPAGFGHQEITTSVCWRWKNGPHRDWEGKNNSHQTEQHMPRYTLVFDRNFVSDWKIGKMCTRVGFLHGSWFLSTRKVRGSHMVLMGLIMVFCSCMIWWICKKRSILCWMSRY